jgi:multidrug efflux pump subunit AcrA (membrane-fusion protein)
LTVVDSGLVAGERVVVDGQSRLVSGAVVDVVGSGTTPAGSGS